MITTGLIDNPLLVYVDGKNVRHGMDIEKFFKAIDLIIHNAGKGEFKKFVIVMRILEMIMVKWFEKNWINLMI